MFKKALAILALGSMTALEAVPLYTNTWSNTEGVSVTKQWGDAANWSVTYEPGVPEPTSAVPTAKSLTKILRSASVTLREGDDLASGSTYFLAGAKSKQLNLLIPTGARLSLNGVDETSWMGAPNTDMWIDGGIDNKVLVDVDGGALVLGQKSFNMRPTMTQYTCTGYNRLQVRNSGVISVTNGYVRMWGGVVSTGKGVYTNIVDILDDSTLELCGLSSFAFGSAPNFVNPHTATGTYGGGWLNVKGGAIVTSASTYQAPILMSVNSASGVGAILNVAEGGKIDLGGQRLYIMSKGTNFVCVGSGGVVSNLSYSVEAGDNTAATYHNLLDINDGKVFLDKCYFISADPVNRGTEARATFRIHGGDSILDLDRWAFASRYTTDGVPPIFADFRLKAHTLRTADFAVRPIRTRMAVWDGAHGGSVNQSIPGVYRVSPDGGFQLAHVDRFELICRKHDSQGEHVPTSTYGGLIGEDMWRTNITTKVGDRWNRYTTYQNAYVFEAILKDEAQLADGVALAVARPRGWLRLPKFTERQLDTARTERISVRLGLEVPTGGASDLNAVVSRMQASGYSSAQVDESVDGYNVRVDLPIDELSANVTTDCVIMDFVDCETYGQAIGAQSMATNALIRTVTCEVAKRPRGLGLIVR